MTLEEIDKNLKVDKTIDKTGYVFRNAEFAPFRLYGVFREGENLCRLPKAVAAATNDGVQRLGTNTAGGRIRFVSDSTRVAIIAKYASIYRGAHFPITGSVGMDLYDTDGYLGSFVPPVDMPNYAYESEVKLDGEKRARVFTVNLPLYSDLVSLHIGLDEDATLESAPDYTLETPVVYYGSSITQGGCASRPGSSYQARITRALDCDHINLGFSGSAKGESAIVDYMAGLKMSAFVCDYDHNAPTPEHLQATHEPLYRKIRANNPDLPIIFVTRPNGFRSLVENCRRRLEIIRSTYDKAVSEGDKNVYFIDGHSFFPHGTDEHTVDGCHPTDLGFFYMAEGIGAVLKEVLKL